MMLECWKSNAEERPNFAELVNRLTSDLVVMANYMDFNAEGNVDQEDTCEIHVNVDIEDTNDIN